MVTALAAIMFVGGCANIASLWLPARVPSSGPALASAPIPNAVVAQCSSVAGQRRQDARANGFDEATAEQVYNGAYRACVTWDMKHGARASD